MNNIINKSVKTILLTTLLSSATMTTADDTEIIDITKEPNSNVLLIMDLSGSMAYSTHNDSLPTGSDKSRKDIAIRALADVLNDTKIKDLKVNVGLSSFAGNRSDPQARQRGHGISFPVSPLFDNSTPANKKEALAVLDSNTVWDHSPNSTKYTDAKSGFIPGIDRYHIGSAHPGIVPSYMSTPSSSMSIIDYLSTKAGSNSTIPDTWDPYGTTPIVDALYEATLYFRGEQPFYGKYDPINKNAAHPSTYTNLFYLNRLPAIYDQTRDCNISATPTPPVLYDSALPDCLLTADSNLLTLSGDPVGTPHIRTSTVNKNCTKFEADGTTLTSCYSDQNSDLRSYNAPPRNYTCGGDRIIYSSFSCNASICSNYNSGSILGQSCTVGVTTTTKYCANTIAPTAGVTRTETDVLNNCAQSFGVGVSECRLYPSTRHVLTFSGEGIPLTYKTVAHASCLVPITPVNICKEITNYERNCSYDKYNNQERIKIYGSTSSLVTANSSTPKYKSPIKEECPSNSIILLSDGQPTANTDSRATQTYININNTSLTNLCSSETILGTSDADPGRCGKNLTKFLANTDHNSSIRGAQVVKTHTIGFALGTSASAVKAKTYLEDLSANGAGIFSTANDITSLKAALLNAITSNARAHSFSSPTYVNTATSMSRGDYVYTPVFDKTNGTIWSGNLKKYKRSGGRLVDRDGNHATNSIGTLIDSAADFWTPTGITSTSAVLSGGVANKLPAPSARKLYTDAGISSGVLGVSNELKVTNTRVSKLLLGNASMSNAHRDKIIAFIRGEKADGTARKHIGDIIHSKPIYVDYGSSKRLFVGTNEGYLHSFDESTGVEKFAFMPSTLLKNINPQYNQLATPHHIYGVDAPITLQHDDLNFNGIVDSGEKAVLYFGLRRGGKAYYAIDISSSTTPKLLWKVEQGSGDFNKLGHTWSKPVVMKMNTSSTTVEQVVVFGGGYVDDNATPPEADNFGPGADVFIVKSSDGSLVWRLSDTNKTQLTNTSTTVTYAVPANIRVMDTSGNDILDRLYFGDTGGNVWRVDFEAKSMDSGEKAKLTHFAELGSSGGSIRKFFTEPDVALFKGKGKNLISIAIGSGNRPDPLGVITGGDAFFLMFDTNVKSTPTSSTSIIEKTDLVNASTGSVTGVLSSAKKGWMMTFSKLKGEKVLSRATTYNNKILFNTFGSLYSTGTTSGCGAINVNKTRLYAIDLMTAKSVVDLDTSGAIDTTGTVDRSIEVAEGEIPGAPQILFDQPSCTAGNCPLSVKVSSGRGLEIPLGDTKVLRKVYWIDKEE
jgi:hypothetical protein